MKVTLRHFPYEYGDRQVYFVGGGLGSLAGAAYLIRDCGFKGENIHIIEGLHILGGSNDGAGDVSQGFVCRGGRMLNEETYENFWELFATIPSLDMPGMSVTEEILNFDHLHPTHAQARLIDKHGRILDVKSMGFSQADRLALGKLMITPEEKLDDMTIEGWFAQTPHFFSTNFWYMWQTTFAFQKWSSLFEFKRYMERMIFEFSRIETLEGVTRTAYNQYESVILPLKAYLDNFKVDFSINATVTDLDFKSGEGITVTAIHLEEDEGERIITLNPGDICIMTNGCMTDSATLGDMYT
ncbi:MAG: oleate hydratase, partial [Niameybacter sp.]